MHHEIRRAFSGNIARQFFLDPVKFAPGNEEGRKLVSAQLDLMHQVLLEIDCFDIFEKPNTTEGT